MAQKIPTRWEMEDHSFEVYTGSCDQTPDVHWHSHFLLHLVTGGSGFQEINRVSYRVQRGNIILLSPTDFHRYIVDGDDRISFCAVKISTELFYQSAKDLCSLDVFPVVAELTEDHYQTAQTIFEILLREQEHREELGYKRFSAALVEQLIILALRGNCGTSSVPPTKMRKAMLYIHCNFKSDVNAAEVARHVGYSPNYFSSEFKRETGIECRKYVRDLRLDYAIKLLKFSSLTVTEVCFECGFHSLAYFSQAFRKKYGFSPDQVKEKEK